MCPEGAAQIFHVVQIYSLSPCHAFSQVLEHSNFKMAGLSPFSLAQIDKYLNTENFKIQMCPGGAAQI